MNFTQFWAIYENSTHAVDPEQKFLPNQANLTIYSWKKLFINLEGCVNTLKGECKDFVARYGNDGDNNTAQSRYQCYYNKVTKQLANQPSWGIGFQMLRTRSIRQVCSRWG